MGEGGAQGSEVEREKKDKKESAVSQPASQFGMRPPSMPISATLMRRECVRKIILDGHEAASRNIAHSPKCSCSLSLV